MVKALARSCRGYSPSFSADRFHVSERQLEMRHHGEQFTGNVDVETRSQNGGVGQHRVAARVAHGDRAPELAAVAGRRELADALSVHEDRLATPWIRSRVVEGEHDQTFLQA